MKAGELCTRRVVTADPDEPITVCALRMEEYGVGDLIVVERSGETVRPIGIVTDRDLAIRGLGHGGPHPARVTARDVMTSNMRVVRDSDDVDTALATLKRHAIRRIPVVGAAGELQGVLSLDDVLAWIGEQMRDVTTLIDRQTAAVGRPADRA